MRERFKTPSRTSPKSSKRGCLCKDGTYSRKCCDGSLQAQGIGRIHALPAKDNMYRVQFCSDGHQHNVWSDTISLVVGNVYYLEIKNYHHDGCYTVLRETTEVGLEIESATLYDDCDTCIAAN